MSEDVIRNIRISVATETSKSEGNLTKILQTLKEIQSLTNSISFPSKKVTALATSLSKLNNVSVGKKFANSVEVIKKSMADLSAAVTNPAATMAAASYIGSYAEIIKANAKTVETATSKERLAYQKRQSVIRNEIKQEQLLNAQAKEARLSAPKVSTVRERTSTTATTSDVQDEAQRRVAAIRDERFAAKDAADAAKEYSRQWGLVCKAIEKSDAESKAFAEHVAAEAAKLTPLIEGMTPALYKAIAAYAKLHSTFGKVASGARTLAHGLKTVASKLLGVTTTLAGKGGMGMASIAIAPFKSLGKHVKSLTTRFTGFLASIKRIALYRAIRFVLKEITQAFKEGTDNLYQYSKAINGVFAQSMDSLATSALYAKNSLAAMASPLINALAPAVDFIVDKFVDFINTINQLIATLTGAQTWTKALKYPKEYAEAADGANGKAKELRATLLGFDEINRLDDNRKGSRGSAAEELDYSKMFEEQTVSSNVKSLAKRIKDAFLEGDFYDLGSELGEKIRDGLNDIPWDSIQDRIKKNAMSAATFINGIVDTEGLPDAIGETLADAFNTVTLKIKTFFGEVKWKKVGKAVGDTLSTAVSKIDVQQLGDALWSVLSAAVETALGMIESSPIVGTIAIAAIGLKYGNLLGLNMGNAVAASGLGSKISGLIPTTARIAVTAAISFKIGNYLYDNVGWIQDLADKLTEGWNQFWDTDAYHAVADFWAKTNGLADEYYLRTSIAESQKQFLMRQGYTESEAYHALMAKERVDQTEDAKKLRELLGLQNSEFRDMISNLKDIKGLTDKEEEALRKLIIQDWIIRFETKFGKTPQEMAQEWMDNLKTKFQPIADKLKEVGGDLGKAIKNGLLDIFTGDTIKNQIKKSLPTRIEVTAVANDSKQTIHAIKAYAGGGDPVTGSMFIAGERGAELVSSSSNGTSVYNRNQIADSVASGNEQTVAALNELISIGQALLEKNNDITTDSISNALSRSNLRAGRTVVVTGG